jgi:hypothetical protein
MARLLAIQNGNLTTAATWNTVTNTPTLHASTNITVNNVATYTATFTAPNTTNKCVGVVVIVNSTPASSNTFSCTLQENSVDTAAVVSVSDTAFPDGAASSAVGNRYLFFKFATPYTFTSTTAGYYRFKFLRTSGTGNFTCAADSGGTTIAMFAIDDRTASPGTTDDLLIGGANGTGTVAVSLTGSQTVGSGTDTTGLTTRTIGSAIRIFSGGLLTFDTTASSTLTHKGNIVGEGSVANKGEIRIATSGSPLSIAYTATIAPDNSAGSGSSGIEIYNNCKWQPHGSALTYFKTKYSSGNGSTATPLITSDAVDWTVGDELVFMSTGSGATNYNEIEYRFIRVKNSSTSYTLSNTSGGAESALTYTHTTDCWIHNLTRNVIIKPPTNNTYFFALNLNSGDCDMSWTRITNYGNSSAQNKYGFYTHGNSATVTTAYFGMNNCVLYGGAYVPLSMAYSTTTETLTGNIIAKTNVSSFNNTWGMTTMSNKTITDWCVASGSFAGLGLVNCTTLTFNNLKINGCNIQDAGTGVTGALMINGSFNIIFNTAEVNANAGRGLMLGICGGITFNNSIIGKATNKIDISCTTNAYSEVLLTNTTFSSATLINNATGMAPGSLIRMATYNATANENRFYTSYGYGQATGTGLADTTLHTTGTGKYAVKLQPYYTPNVYSYIYSLPTGNIGTYPVTVSVWVKINSATFYAGSHTNPTLSVNYDNGTVSTAVASNSTAWQQLTVTVTPTTTYGQITVSMNAVTDATLTNADYYVDDYEVTYPAGFSTNLATLDVWANGMPVTPASDTSGVISYNWNNDPYIVDSEATSLAFTGITLNYSAKTITITSNHSITEVYEYCKASARANNVTYSLSTRDGVTYTPASGWTVTINGCRVTSTTQKFSTMPTLGTNGFVEQITGVTWYDGTHTYYAKHFYKNVKDSTTSSNQQYAVVAYLDSTYADRTYNTSLTSGGITTDSSGNAEGYAVYKVDSTNYTVNEYVGLYGFIWSIVPVSNNGLSIGSSGTYDTARLVTDSYVTLSRTAALALSGITVNRSTKVINLNSHTLSQAQDNLKARQTQTALIDGSMEGYESYINDGWYLANNGSVYVGKSTYSFTNSGDTQTFSGATLVENTPGTINDPVNTMTYDFQSAGTYDLRGASITGMIHLNTSNNSTVTVKLLPTVTYVNDVPAHITVDNAFNVTLTVGNIVSGSRIQVYNLDTSTELYNEIVSGTTWTKTYVYASDVNIRVRLMYVNGLTAYYWYTATTKITSSGFNINAAQIENTVYETASIDGSTVTECSVSGTTIRIYVNTSAPYTISAQRIYNWYQYLLSTASGIRDQDGQYITAIDTTHYVFQNVAGVGMKLYCQTQYVNVLGANITPSDGGLSSNIWDQAGGSIFPNYNRVEGFQYSPIVNNYNDTLVALEI